MADFDPMDGYLKEAFARMTEGTDPDRVADSVRERIGFEKERNTGHTKRHRKRLTLLLAAAAALILLTTAAAAAVMAVQARMRAVIAEPEEHDGEIIQSYSMDIEEHSNNPILSDEVMEKLDAMPLPSTVGGMITDAIAEGSALRFEQWEEAEEWLDCDLLIDPLLGPSPYEAGQLSLSYNHLPFDESRSVSLSGTHTYPDTKARVNVDAYIPLNDSAWEVYDGGLSMVTQEEVEPVTDTMTTVYGDEVSLVSNTIVSEIMTQYAVDAHFIHEGIIYKISVWYNNLDEAESVVRRVVEGMR